MASALTLIATVTGVVGVAVPVVRFGVEMLFRFVG